MDDRLSTHKKVKEYYGKVANQPGGCCGTSSGHNKIQNTLYPPELLSKLPEDVTNFTAGSGDPISLAKLQPGETVLDLGSGAGLDCFLAARLVGVKGHVIGVDMTPQMLERARSAKQRLDAENIDFREGYLEGLPVDDASIDAVISNCVINLSPDKPRVFREILRVLKPGGRMAVSDMVANRSLPNDTGRGEEWCGCTAGALSQAELMQELTEAGFVDIQLELNTESILKAVDCGQVNSFGYVGTDNLLDDVQKWEQCDQTLVVPFKIQARKSDDKLNKGQ